MNIRCSKIALILLSDPFGDTARGATKSDAKLLRSDIQSALAGDNLSKVRELIKVDKDKVSIATVAQGDVDKAVQGKQLSADEKALLQGIINTINSKSVNYVEYEDPGDMISANGLKALHLDPNDPNRRLARAAALSGTTADAIPAGQLPAGFLNIIGGAGTGAFGDNGSYSVILKTSLISNNNSGYFNSTTNQPVASPDIQAYYS